MIKKARNILLGLSVLFAASACVVAPAPRYATPYYPQHHPYYQQVEVITVRPAPYYRPVPPHRPPPAHYRSEPRREHHHEHSNGRGRDREKHGHDDDRD